MSLALQSTKVGGEGLGHDSFFIKITMISDFVDTRKTSSSGRLFDDYFLSTIRNVDYIRKANYYRGCFLLLMNAFTLRHAHNEISLVEWRIVEILHLEFEDDGTRQV